MSPMADRGPGHADRWDPGHRGAGGPGAERRAGLVVGRPGRRGTCSSSTRPARYGRSSSRSFREPGSTARRATIQVLGTAAVLPYWTLTSYDHLTRKWGPRRPRGSGPSGAVESGLGAGGVGQAAWARVTVYRGLRAGRLPSAAGLRPSNHRLTRAGPCRAPARAGRRCYKGRHRPRSRPAAASPGR